jgi:peptide subunit release factor 1 (eRF1)
MSKKRDVVKELHYKEIINKQKKMIQDLKKKAGRAHKLEERYSDLEEREAELLLEEEETSRPGPKYGCPKCSGELYVIDGSRMKVFICHDCGYRASKRG